MQPEADKKGQAERERVCVCVRVCMWSVFYYLLSLACNPPPYHHLSAIIGRQHVRSAATLAMGTIDILGLIKSPNFHLLMPHRECADAFAHKSASRFTLSDQNKTTTKVQEKKAFQQDKMRQPCANLQRRRLIPSNKPLFVLFVFVFLLLLLLLLLCVCVCVCVCWGGYTITT